MKPRLATIPSLDGIRGLAVLAVVAFHVGAPWATGGFLGVSVFFTLSGFLITRLLLDDADRHRLVDLGRFWARRARRLLPAMLATVVLVLVLQPLALHLDPSVLRVDVLGALGYVANWRFLLAGSSYVDLFHLPSPFLHFWSLAIEEQFYVLFPPVVWLVVRRARDRASGDARARARGDVRGRLRPVVVVGIIGSVAVTLALASAGLTDAVYFSLPTRAAELLVGALLATTWWSWRLPERRAGWSLTLIGVGALVAIAALVATTTRASTWVTDGGLPVFAVLSAAVVACALPAGPLRRALSAMPLRALGWISYGVYLYHWPVILWLTPARTGMSGTALALVQVGVTLALAVPSYVLLEQPIRHGRALRIPTRARAAAFAGVGAALVATLVSTAVVREPAPAVDIAAAARELETLVETPAAAASPSAGAPAATVPSGEAVPRAPRIAFFGDSSALLTATGFGRFAAEHGGVDLVEGAAFYGCGLLREGPTRFGDKVVGPPTACGSLEAQWNAALDRAPDLAVVQVGPIEVDDHRLAGDDQWRAPGDPTYDARLKAAMLAAVDLVVARGATPVWLTSPTISHPLLPAPVPSSDPARMRRFNDLLAQVATERPALRVIDLAGWVERQPGGAAATDLRPDGVHFSPESAAARVAPWLAGELLAVWLHPGSTVGTP